MSSSHGFAPNLESFDGTNYSLWAYKMRMYLMFKGLWEAVDNATSVTAEKKRQAHAAIILNLSDSQLIHVIIATTARDA